MKSWTSSIDQSDECSFGCFESSKGLLQYPLWCATCANSQLHSTWATWEPGCAQIARITITDKCRIRRWEGERSWLILHLLQRQQTINLFVSRTHWQGMWASLGLAPATVGSEVRGESFVELHLLWLPQRDSILRELWTATRFWQINLRLSRWAAGTNKFLLAQLKEARHMPQFSN